MRPKSVLCHACNPNNDKPKFKFTICCRCWSFDLSILLSVVLPGGGFYVWTLFRLTKISSALKHNTILCIHDHKTAYGFCGWRVSILCKYQPTYLEREKKNRQQLFYTSQIGSFFMQVKYIRLESIETTNSRANNLDLFARKPQKREKSRAFALCFVHCG